MRTITVLYIVDGIKNILYQYKIYQIFYLVYFVLEYTKTGIIGVRGYLSPYVE